jgi:uncharacterized phage-like protein YoqJ
MEVGQYLGIPVIGILPFEGFDAKWPLPSKSKLKNLLDKCIDVVYACEPGYEAWKLQKRNEVLVDHCDSLVAYWTGVPGGTANCIDYAVSKKRQVDIFDVKEILCQNNQ